MVERVDGSKQADPCFERGLPGVENPWKAFSVRRVGNILGNTPTENIWLLL
jgi:hypothetical protein